MKTGVLCVDDKQDSIHPSFFSRIVTEVSYFLKKIIFCAYVHRNCLMNRFCAPNAINFMFIATNISGWNFYNLPVSSGATRSVDEVLSHWASWANVEEKLQKCVGDFNPLNPELNLICCLLALLAHHFLHVSRIRVKSLTPRQLMSYIYGAPILDVSRSHTTAHHSR